MYTLSSGTEGEHPGLFRIELTEGSGSCAKVLNTPVPGPLKESIRYAEQNLYALTMQLLVKEIYTW